VELLAWPSNPLPFRSSANGDVFSFPFAAASSANRELWSDALYSEVLCEVFERKTSHTHAAHQFTGEELQLKHSGGFCRVIENDGRPVGTRTPDLYRVKVTTLSFIITYKTAGTAKIRGSRARHIRLWVELWVDIIKDAPPSYASLSRNLLRNQSSQAESGQPNFHPCKHKLVSGATVAGGGIVCVRYQRGYLRLGHRRCGPDCWEFLWWTKIRCGFC
jgi:hypothetical protein